MFMRQALEIDLAGDFQATYNISAVRSVGSGASRGCLMSRASFLWPLITVEIERLVVIA
jgi:hypothetical protein